MKYIIYEIVSPSVLSEIDDSNYHPRKITSCALKPLYTHSIEDKHDTMDSALQEIKKNKEKLKLTKLTIIPVIDINWDGEIQ